MSIIVYGTWCNPSPQFGLSFYCQGSASACDIFRNFTSVSCLSQPSQLYCTNQQACGGANITNDIYIEFPSAEPLTATDYDTITRADYQFNQTIPVAAYTTSSTARRDVPLLSELTRRSAPIPTLSQKVISTFQNIYNGNSVNPTKLLVNSLASTLFGLNVTGGMTSSVALQNEIRDALFDAMASSTYTTIAQVQQCEELNATADGMLSVNKQFITNITRQIPQPSLATWLLTNFVGHIIVNSAVAAEVDIIKADVVSSSASTCVPLSVTSVTSSTSMPKPSTTSKSSSASSSSTTPSASSTTSSKSSTASSKTSTTASKTSSKLSISSKSSTSSTSSKSSTTSQTLKSLSSSSSRSTTSNSIGTASGISQSVAASSFTTHSCPSATPTGSLVYRSNSTQNQALNGSFAIYNGSMAHLQNVLLAPVNASSALYSFPNSNTIALTLSNGEALIYTANVSAITYIEAGCGTAIKFYNTNASKNASIASRMASRDGHILQRASSGVSVIMSVTDQCGNPVTSGYTLQLDCAMVLYPQTNAASGPVVEPPTPEIFDNTGGGTYTAVCDLSGLDSANAAYNTCASQDSESLDNFCGKQLNTVNDAKSYIGKFIKVAKEYASLVKYTNLLEEVLENTKPALTFWARMCDKQFGLENPLVQKQFDAEDCGYPAALSMALEGENAGGSPFTSPLGTYAATPTTLYLSTTTSLTSQSCCGTATPTAAPDYVYVSDNCTSYSAGLGKAVFCCSGMCLDGSKIGNPGQCEYWLDLCGDVEGGAPSCSANQVLSYGDPPTVDSGDGCCGACCCECQYQRNNWSYSCCDCPAGYKAVDSGACDGSSNQCVGCSDPRLTLVQSGNGTYSCVCGGN